ncbi:MAG TPA: hypothetical protein VLS48_00165, partial [Anaerolineales bacterium]|nr:hypothetical protein [Anaerolineales bacterium]
MKIKGIVSSILLALLVLSVALVGRAERAVVQPAGAFDVAVKGHFGGHPGFILLDGNTAYMGLGGSVGVLDISDPAQPRHVGQVILPTEIEDMALAGATLYVAARYSGFYVVDVSDPAAPAILAQGVNDLPGGLWPLTANIVRQVEVQGDYAYLLTGEDVYVVGPEETEQQRMLVVDISDPSRPTYAASLSWQGEVVNSLAVYGQYAYLLMKWSNGLHIVDLTNPAAPQEVQIAADIIGARKLQVVGDRLITYGGWNDTRIWDLSDPLYPVEAGVLGSFAENITVSEERLFTLNYNLPLAVYQIPAAGQPAYLGEYETGVENIYLAVQGDYLFVSNANYELVVLDVHDPAVIQSVGRYQSALPAHDASVFQDGYAYTPTVRGLEIHSLADPLAPMPVGQYLIGDPDQPSYWQTALAVKDGIAYLSRNENPGIAPGGLYILDVSDPTQPALITTTVEAPNVLNLAFVGDYLYLSTTTGLRIANVSNPAAPVFTDFFDPYLRFNDLQISGSYAYLAGLASADVVDFEDYNHRFVVLDISDPAAPVEVGAVPVGMIEPIPQRLFLKGDQAVLLYAISLGAYNRLETFDISNPAQPTSIGGYNPGDGEPWFTTDAFLSGDTLLIADTGVGLRMLDISDPLNPLPIGEFPINRTSSFSTSGGYFVNVVGENIYFSVNPLGWSILQYTGLSIGGRLLQPNGLPFTSPTVVLDAAQTTQPDAQGVYLFDELPLGAYTLAPEHMGYRFLPPQQVIDVPPSTRAVDFMALAAPQSQTLAPDAAHALVFTDTQGLPTGLTVPIGSVAAPAMVVVTPTLAPL